MCRRLCTSDCLSQAKLTLAFWRMVAMLVVVPYMDSPRRVILQVTLRIVMSFTFENLFASSTDDNSTTHVRSFLLSSHATIGD